MYDTATTSRKKGKFYDVERIITRRRARNDYEHLIKWHGWPIDTCSWEPSINLTSDLLRKYDFPRNITDERLQGACRALSAASLTTIRGKTTSSFYANIELDIWRYVMHNKGIPSAHRGHFLYEKIDFRRWKHLPAHWWYFLDANDEGQAVDFPLKAKPILCWTPAHYFNKDKELCKAQRYPMEKICLTISKRPCNLQNIG